MPHPAGKRKRPQRPIGGSIAAAVASLATVTAIRIAEESRPVATVAAIDQTQTPEHRDNANGGEHGRGKIASERGNDGRDGRRIRQVQPPPVARGRR